MDTDKIMEEELHNMEIADNIEKMPPAEKEPMSTILLIGSSGAGKTTLVNTVFDTRMASNSTFSGGNTPDIRVSENAALNYRVIDTMGLELGFKTAAMALADDAISLASNSLKETDKLAIMIGNEGNGLPTDVIERADHKVIIPMYNGVDSLNAAAASAVAFWELRKDSTE